MVMWNNSRIFPVKLIGISNRAKKILDCYDGNLFLVENDTLGRPLSISPNGKQGIFCISPDFFWNGWLVLDEDVRFEKEEQSLHDIIKMMKEDDDDV